MKNIKKLFIITAVMTMLLICGITVNAQSYSLPTLKFNIGSNWSVEESDNSSLVFTRTGNGDEYISASVYDKPGLLLTDELDEGGIKNVMRDIYSDSNIAQIIQKQNKAARDIKVSTSSEIGSYEIINGIKFYRYEKYVRITSANYLFNDKYFTVYYGIYNNRIYCLTYERNNNANHFNEFSDLLASCEITRMKIKVNGRYIESDSDPMIFNDRTMVPIRAVAEALGYSVSWDSEYQLVGLSNGINGIIFGVGYYEVIKDGEEYYIDSAPFILADRTYIPVRAAAELMDAEVGWDGSTQTVIITR